jgi:hypothetical protein
MTKIELDDRPSDPVEEPAEEPRAPAPAVVPPPPPPAPPPAKIVDDEELPPPRTREIPEEVRDLLAQFGDESGYIMKIERAYPMEDAGFLYSVPLDSSFSEEEIKRTCGGRVFRLKVYDTQNHYVTCRTVRIDDVPRRDGIPIVHKKDEDEKKPSELGELAGVLREMLTRQQAAQERQQALIEKLLLEGSGDSGGDQPDALGMLEQTAAVIAAVREMAPSVGAGGDGGGGDTSSALMLKFGEKLLDKLDSKKEEKKAPAAAAPTKTIRILRGGPPAPPGAPRAPRPAAPPAPHLPESTPAPAVTRRPPDPPPLAAAAELLEAPAPPLAAVPDDDETVDESSTEEGFEITPDDVLEGLSAMPLEEAAQVVRGLFHKLTPADQEKAVKIIIS